MIEINKFACMKKTVIVTRTTEIEVEIDVSKFTKEFIAEYVRNFYPHHEIDDHIKHIAWLKSENHLDEFTAGYGHISELGISARIINETTETELD